MVVGIGGVILVTEGVCGAFAHDAMMNDRVFGPTAPYPVVAGDPEDAIPFFDCHCLTAASVIAPKEPVAESDVRNF